MSYGKDKKTILNKNVYTLLFCYSESITSPVTFGRQSSERLLITDNDNEKTYILQNNNTDFT